MKADMSYRVVQDGSDLGIHAVIVRDDGDIIGISKYPVGPRNNGKGIISFNKEIEKYYIDSTSNPPITNWDFCAWDYFIINSWQGEIVSDEQVAKWVESQLEYYK